MVKDITLQTRWWNICDEYVRVFCEKHGYTYEPDMWVGDDPGGITEVCDMFVHLDDIRYDVDNDIKPDMFPDWYWKGLEIYELTGFKYMNYPSFCKGAPDEWTPERMEKIRETHRRIEDEKKKLQELIEECKK